MLHCRIEMNARLGTVEIASGIRGFRLLRLGGSAFHGFVRDQYTTLPDIKNRPLHMWLDLEWTYTRLQPRSARGRLPRRCAQWFARYLKASSPGSIQQIIYQIGTKMLAEIPEIAEIHLEGENRTWDTVAEHGDELGVYTEARPPYGCLGLRLRRDGT